MTSRSLLAAMLTISCVAVPAAQIPRDRLVTPPDKPVTSAEAALVAKIAAAPSELGPRLALARLQEETGRYAEAEATLMTAKSALPPSPALMEGIAAYYNRQGDFDKTVSHLEDSARLDPSNPQGYHLVGSYYQEKAAKDTRLTVEQKRAYIEAGIAAEDTALALRPDYIEALVYKNILLRLLSRIDLANSDRLVAEANVLRNRAMELQKQGEATRMAGAAAGPPPPAPPPMPSAQAPIRVGGNVRPPQKTRHVPPVYPPDALAVGIRGVVICEVIIDSAGRVGDVKILRSIPQLDTAAADAVRQWEFEPTYLNGMAVPVIMTVTVNFTVE